MIHLIGHTQNNIPVEVDLISSDAAKPIAQQPHLLTLAAEALQHTAPTSAQENIVHDMGRVVGYDFVIETTDADTIFYAQLTKSTVYTRFVKSNKPLATQYLTLVLQRPQEDGQYRLENVWVGSYRPAFPGSADETAESHAFWQNHAVIFEKQPIQASTLTKTWPY